MSLAQVLDDLRELEELAQDEDNATRRLALEKVRSHVAQREQGAKVSEAAVVLGLSQPTVRAWIDAGILPALPMTKPVRVDVLALADLKRVVDLVRDNLADRQLLVHVMRLLRYRAALEDAGQGFEDYRAGRTMPLGDDLRAEIARLPKQGEA